MIRVRRATAKASGGDQWQATGDLREGDVECGSRFLLAATAAVGAARASLQITKRARPIGRFAANIVVGDSIAEADIHARMRTRIRMIVNN